MRRSAISHGSPIPNAARAELPRLTMLAPVAARAHLFAHVRDDASITEPVGACVPHARREARARGARDHGAARDTARAASRLASTVVETCRTIRQETTGSETPSGVVGRDRGPREDVPPRAEDPRCRTRRARPRRTAIARRARSSDRAPLPRSRTSPPIAGSASDHAHRCDVCLAVATTAQPRTGDASRPARDRDLAGDVPRGPGRKRDDELRARKQVRGAGLATVRDRSSPIVHLRSIACGPTGVGAAGFAIEPNVATSSADRTSVNVQVALRWSRARAYRDRDGAPASFRSRTSGRFRPHPTRRAATRSRLRSGARARARACRRTAAREVENGTGMEVARVGREPLPALGRSPVGACARRDAGSGSGCRSRRPVVLEKQRRRTPRGPSRRTWSSGRVGRARRRFASTCVSSSS